MSCLCSHSKTHTSGYCRWLPGWYNETEGDRDIYSQSRVNKWGVKMAVLSGNQYIAILKRRTLYDCLLTILNCYCFIQFLRKANFRVSTLKDRTEWKHTGVVPDFRICAYAGFFGSKTKWRGRLWNWVGERPNDINSRTCRIFAGNSYLTRTCNARLMSNGGKLVTKNALWSS